MGAAQRRLAVRFDEAVWREAVRGFSRRPLEIATSARSEAERRGIALAAVIPCEPLGPDGTALAGCAKLYLPAGDDPPSERPSPSSCSSRGSPTRRSSGCSSRSVTATRGPACAASTSERIASCTAAFRSRADVASPIVRQRGAQSGAQFEHHTPNEAQLAGPNTPWLQGLSSDRLVRAQYRP